MDYEIKTRTEKNRHDKLDFGTPTLHVISDKRNGLEESGSIKWKLNCASIYTNLYYKHEEHAVSY